MDDRGYRSLNVLARNAAALLTSDVLNKATTFLVYAMVSRWLGAAAFGQLSLGLLLLYLFQVVASAGMPTLITREIARRRRIAGRVLTGGLATATLVGMAATLMMLVAPVVLNYESETAAVIMALSVGLLPYAWALVIEAAFRGLEQMHWIAVSNVFANIAKVVGAVWLLTTGWGVLAIAGWLVVVRLLIAISNLALYLWCNGWFWRRFQRRYVRVLMSRTATFLGIDSVIAIWGAVDAVLLSKLMSETEVGIYCAAAQLLQPVLLVFRSLVGSVFPGMCQRAFGDRQNLLYLVRWMVSFLLAIGVPVTLLIPGVAPLLLKIAYDAAEFQLGVPLMYVGSVAIVLKALTSVLGHSLWAVHRERATLRIVIVDVIANVVLGLLLIPLFGMMGAAVGSLLVGFLNAGQHYLACYRQFESAPVDRQSLMPLVAGAGGAGLLLAVFPIQPMVAAISGVLAYAVILALLLKWFYGGWANMFARYFVPLVGSAT